MAECVSTVFYPDNKWICTMNKSVQIIALIIVASGITGCASLRVYSVDRVRDVSDVCTLTAGLGTGAKIRIGYLTRPSFGVFWNKDVTGLRGGEFFAAVGPEAPRNSVASLGLPMPGAIIIPERDDFYGLASAETEEVTARIKSRHKAYLVSENELVQSDTFTRWYYYTQCEVALGLGVTAKAGFNLAEIIDLLLGFTYIDILNDDVSQHEVSSQEHTVPKPKRSTSEL